MRRCAALILIVVPMTLACGGNTPHVSSVSSARIGSATPTASSAGCTAAAAAYGLVVVNNATLEMISPKGCVAASTSIRPTADQLCPSGMADVAPPAVSASNDKVYYRDGDTRIRYLMADGSTGDVTTVPGGVNTRSFFSVSPDDRRIAVLVETGGSAVINLSLYVEDLNGGGHHSVIYTNQITNGKGGMTLWPMGWHGTNLVLAVVPACTFEALPAPLAYHVADSTTARRLVDIDGSKCHLSWWPSPNGVLCVDALSRVVRGYDWAGQENFGTQALPTDDQSGRAPGSPWWFFASASGIGAPPPETRIFFAIAGQGVVVSGHLGCLWIDDQTVLAPDAVMAYPDGAVTMLPAAGVCAGRLPGLL